MPEPRAITGQRAEKWPGRFSNADPHDLPPGGMVVQDNLQSLVPGQLSVRKGVVKSADYTPSSPAAYTVISLFGYNVPDTDWMIGADTNGTVKARRSSGTTTTFGTGKSGWWPWSFEKSRQGDAIMVNGMDRGMVWNGLQGNSTPNELGIDAPAAAPTVASPAGGAATVGDYTCPYRYVDDSVPQERYSSISTTTVHTAAENDEFEWTALSASSQSRVILVEIWRSAAVAGNRLYRIARLGHDGTVSTITDNGSTKCRITCTAAHNLSVGAVLTVAGSDVGGYNTSHEVTAVISTTVVDTDVAYSTDGTGGTWQLTGFKNDTSSDATLVAAADSDPDLALHITNANGQPEARRHGVPPKWKSVVKSFQDRFFYAVDVVYDSGTVTTAGSTTITHSQNNEWTSDMDGRYIWIDGESEPLKISSVTPGSPDTLTTTGAASTSAAGKSYAIRSDPKEWNKLVYSEQDLPESVATSGPTSTPDTIVNTVTIQENTDDDDTLQGLMPFGSVLYCLKERHIYSLTFARQPKIDATPKLIAHRGVLNQRCYDVHEAVAYLMDEAGCYRMTMDGNITPISHAIQDVFRDPDVDFSKKKWFHVVCDPRFELVYFFVVMSGDTYPQDALVYSIRTGAFWTESYFDDMPDSAKAIASGAITVWLAGSSDRVYQLNGDETDYVTSQTRGTATAGGNNTLTDSAASFTDAVIGAPVCLESGTGKGQVRTISARTSTQLTVSANWTTNPDSTSVYRIGGILYSAKTGRMKVPDVAEHNQRSVEVTFEPTTGVNKFDVRRFLNHGTTASTFSGDESETGGGGISYSNGDTDAVCNMKLTRSSDSDNSGWCKVTFPGRAASRGEGVRYVQIELRGIKGDDSINFYNVQFSGVG